MNTQTLPANLRHDKTTFNSKFNSKTKLDDIYQCIMQNTTLTKPITFLPCPSVLG